MANLFTVLASAATTMSTAGRNLVIAASAAAQRTALGSTAVGDAVFTAINQAAARSAMGAGTSDLVIGTTTGTAYDGALGAAAASAAAAAQTTANAALPKAGGTMTGDIAMSGTQRITNSLVPTAAGQGMVVPASVANGDLFAWAGGTLVRVASGGSNTFVGGDGTNVVSLTQAQAIAGLGLGVQIAPMTGAGWTTTATGAGVTAAYASSKLSVAIPGATIGNGKSLIATLPGWTAGGYSDFLFRCQIVTGNGVSNTRCVITAGVDASNNVTMALYGDGTLESAFNAAGVYTAITITSTIVSSGQRTGGQLWLRISRSPGAVTFMWGVGSGGAVPTSWFNVGNTSTTAAIAQVASGTFGFVQALTFDTSIPGGYAVDFLAIHSAQQMPGSL